MMRLFTALSLLAALFAGGCGGHGKRPATHAVTGTVIYQNGAVANAEVVFHPQAESEIARPARGRTNAEGKFSLRTYFSPTDDAQGAVAGQYTVTVSQSEANERVVGTENFTPPKNTLPAKFSSAKTSPLSATVAQGANAPLELKLTDE